MLDNFIFSVNAILPVIVMVILGWILKNKGFLPESFFGYADKFVFKIALTCNLFVSVIKGDVAKLKTSFPLMLFACAVILSSSSALPRR